MFYAEYIKLCNGIGKSPSAVAEELGFKKSAVTRWKQGSIPTDGNKSKIASYFGVSVDDLLTGEQKEKALTPEGEREIDDADLKAAFWGGEKDLSPDELDEMWEDVKEYARYKMEQRRKKNDKPSGTL